MATVLSLDIAGALDTVNHARLIDNLQKKGLPWWLTKLIRSFRTSRSTTLIIDDNEIEPQNLQGGVPQGSPLSPIFVSFL